MNTATAENLVVRGHRDFGATVCRICREAIGYDDTDRCYISTVRTDSYRPRYYSYCIDCAVSTGIAPNANRCPN